MGSRHATRPVPDAPLRPASGVSGRFADLPEVTALDPRIVGVLTLSSLLLALYSFFGTDDFYWDRLEEPLRAALGLPRGAGPDLVAFWYQTLSVVSLRILIPLACILLVFRESPREYGFRLPEPGHNRTYLGLLLVMLPVLAAVSFLPGFQRMYPIFPGAYHAGPAVAASYLTAYALRFVAAEAFFRGFLLFALFRRFGYHAVAIMVVPYCMIHFNKPFLEAIGSIVAGFLLGFLALRSRSWLPGALLHCGVAFAMDLLGLMQRGLLR